MKNLETEYRDQISMELPDLWSRIEAGVDAYEASKNNETVIAKEANDNIVSINKKKNSSIARFIPYISAAACLILVAGAFGLMNTAKSNSAPTADCAPAADCESSYDADENIAYETDDMSNAAEECTEAEAEYDSDDYRGEATGAAAATDNSDGISKNEEATVKEDAKETKDVADAADSSEVVTVTDIAVDIADILSTNEENANVILNTCEAAKIDIDAITKLKLVDSEYGTVLMTLANEQTYLVFIDDSTEPYFVWMITKDTPDGEVVY